MSTMVKTITVLSKAEVVQTDAELWRAFKDGSEVALGEIFKTHYPGLYDYLFKIFRNAEMAENAIQELFLHLWQNRKTLGEAQSIRFYLISSARRRALKQLSHLRRYVSDDIESTSEDWLFDFSPEDLLISQETSDAQREVLLQVIEQLPKRQKEVVYLRYYQNLSLNEIAEVLSIHYQSVLNNLNRAFNTLRSSKQIKRLIDIALFVLIPASLCSLTILP
jgi:RNA polymerase sigma factor (sigma-70 family)